MTSVKHTQSVSIGTGGIEAVHLLLTEGDVKLMAEAPEKVMKEIHARAERVSAVLEGILSESHGHVRWGLNE
jgi:hypothetical protein